MTTHPELDRSRDYALKQDQADALGHLRQHFIFPSVADLKRTELGDPTTAANVPTSQTQHQNGARNATSSTNPEDRPCTYLCGNSLGLQPRITRKYVDDHLRMWATKGVYGHFKPVTGTPIKPWVDLDREVQAPMARIVGAEPEEVAVMQTLTANLHILLSSFYRPTQARHKIIIESKAFPSDHYAVESQLRHHARDPAESLILLEPADADHPVLTTDYILSVIDAHAASTAILLLPGIQFYTGQLFDIPRITAHAQAAGLLVGWDLAHAAGNVPLSLHAWNVDFAAWCTYKYLNAGPGAIGALYAHTRHAAAHAGAAPAARKADPRLAGWWGQDNAARFAMRNATFDPAPGARGWQLSNPSALDMAALQASLATFGRADMPALRARSLALTGYLERLLDAWPFGGAPPYGIITPRDVDARGAQLSVRLAPGLLAGVMAALEEAGVVVDERDPDVVRVAPAPMYNSFEDCWLFADVFQRACWDLVQKKNKTPDDAQLAS